MCGQLGVAGSITFPAEKAFQRLLVYNSVRGLDSTGAASVKRNLKNGAFEVAVAKELGHPYNLFDVTRKNDQDWDDVKSGQHRVLLGHCRAATKGSLTRKNAHPFWVENIIGTHNGTLGHRSQSELSGYASCDTDSEAIFNEIETAGIAETVKKFTAHDDAYALVWFDCRDNTVNFLRNKERPLYFAFSKDKQMLFWSSEALHLMSGMSDIPHEDKYIHELEVDTQYSWEIPAISQPFGKAKVTKRETVKGPFVNPTFGKHGHHNANQDFSGTSAPAWFDKRSNFWKKWNIATSSHEYSILESGPYFKSVLMCWNSLTVQQKKDRASCGTIPDTVPYSSAWLDTPAGTNSVSMISKVWDSNSRTWKYYPNDQAPTGDNISNLSDNLTRVNHNMDTAKEKRREGIFSSKNGCVVWKNPGNTQQVWWEYQTKMYVTLDFEGFNNGWKVERSRTCPDQVPYTDHDIMARHQWKHEGKPGKKISYFRGFEKQLLVQTTFEKLMEAGCMECNRKPKWGNDVTFINTTDFLCEHCKRDTSKIKEWQEASNA